jgi:penicillin amidase
MASVNSALTRPPRPWLRWAATAFLLLVAAAAFAILSGAWWIRHDMRATLPQLDGTLRIPGLAAPALVRRDRHGVPHIQAASVDDLVFAQGYITAQDRLWQMDMARRLAAGDAAQVLGSSLVAHDKLERTLLLLPTAQRIAAAMSPAEQRYFADYARGVNAYIARHRHNLPTPFRVLMYRPQPWTSVDSVLIGLSMVQMLDEHWPDKLARQQITARLGPALAAILYPTGSRRDHPPGNDQPSNSAPAPILSQASPDPSQAAVRLPRPAWSRGVTADLSRLRAIDGQPACRGCTSGSNEWVVSGAHTASGKPILSNDMHLEIQIPGIWYEADLEAPGLHAAGVTVPGIPFVLAGHNNHIAWGFTALYADTQDLYIEHLNRSGTAYHDATGWHRLTVRHESIPVRGGPSVPLTIRITGHGPILNPLLPHIRETLSLRWTAYDSNANQLPLFELDTASNWTSLRAALAQWWAPTLNVVYADDQGNIGYQAIGYVPCRPGGLAGVPIADDHHEWQGMIPFNALPRSYNPPQGLLATANARVTPTGDPMPLTLEWADPYRNQRIWQVLTGRSGLTPADMLALQNDVYSALDQLVAQRLVYAIDHARHPTNRLRQAASLMRTWNGEVTTASPAAAIVDATRSVFWRMLLQPKLGSRWTLYSWDESQYAEEQLLVHQPSGWLPRRYHSWNGFLAAMVTEGLREKHAPHDLAHWQFGSWHVVEVQHPLWGMLPWFHNWTGVGPLPQSGDTSTVKHVARTFGPSQRFTIDFGNPDAATENLVIGQSGNPLSPWYRDQWPFWYHGTTFTLPYGNTEVSQSTTHTLHLLP